MEQPKSFALLGNEHKICKLIKSLYGLKQTFDYVILEYSFKHKSADKCIYCKFTNDFGVIIYLYVDDILIISTNINDVNDTKKYLTFKIQNEKLK
jgi:hypothetical protein